MASSRIRPPTPAHPHSPAPLAPSPSPSGPTGHQGAPSHPEKDGETIPTSLVPRKREEGPMQREEEGDS